MWNSRVLLNKNHYPSSRGEALIDQSRVFKIKANGPFSFFTFAYYSRNTILSILNLYENISSDISMCSSDKSNILLDSISFIIFLFLLFRLLDTNIYTYQVIYIIILLDLFILFFSFISVIFYVYIFYMSGLNRYNISKYFQTQMIPI